MKYLSKAFWIIVGIVFSLVIVTFVCLFMLLNGISDEDKIFSEFEGSVDTSFSEFEESVDTSFSEFEDSVDTGFSDFEDTLDKWAEETRLGWKSIRSDLKELLKKVGI